MIGAIGDFLPLSMAVALNPLVIIALVMVLGGADGVRAGAAFAVGWLLALGLLTLVLLIAAGEADKLSLGLGPVMQVAIGLGLLFAAARKWRTRPRGKAEPALPRWAAALGRATPAKAAMLGAALAGINPKHLVLTIAAVAIIAERELDTRAALIAGAVFVLLSSAGVLGVLALRRTGGAQGVQRLEGLRRFMLRNNNVIVMILLIVIGGKVLGDGLAAWN